MLNYGTARTYLLQCCVISWVMIIFPHLIWKKTIRFLQMRRNSDQDMTPTFPIEFGNRIVTYSSRLLIFSPYFWASYHLWSKHKQIIFPRWRTLRFRAIHKWCYPLFEIFGPSLPLVTHITKYVYGVTSPFGRSPPPF